MLVRIKNLSDQTLPVNKGANKRLDCEVIKYLHETNRKEGLQAYDTIRCAFLEGKPVYPGSSFTDKLHIEICVLKPELIKGYFLPRPVEQFNPFLNGLANL